VKVRARNRYVADILNEASLATLPIDLLTADEQAADRKTGQLGSTSRS
jgi:hypothetical protein